MQIDRYYVVKWVDLMNILLLTDHRMKGGEKMGKKGDAHHDAAIKDQR